MLYLQWQLCINARFTSKFNNHSTTRQTLVSYRLSDYSNPYCFPSPAGLSSETDVSMLNTASFPQLEVIDQALEANDLRKAELHIARLLRSDTQTDLRAQLLLRRARVRLLNGRPDEALEDSQEVIALAPSLGEMPEVKMTLGDIHLARFMLAELGFAVRSDTDRALEYYNEILTRHPHFKQRGWVFYQRGRIYLSENRVDEAIADFEESLRRERRPYALHAYCYERLGFIAMYEQRQVTQALDYLDRAIDVYPTGENAAWLVQVHILRSRVLRELGDYEAALTAASKALNALDTGAPNYREALTEAHLAVGEILALIPRRENEALEHLLEFLQTSKRPLGVDVTWSRVYETMGDLYFKLEKSEQAVEAYQTCLVFNPLHPLAVNVHYQIARCHYRMRQYEKVIASIDKLLETAESDMQWIGDYRVFNVLGNAHFALEHYHKAAQAYRQAVDLAPSNAEGLDKIKKYLNFSEELAGT